MRYQRMTVSEIQRCLDDEKGRGAYVGTGVCDHTFLGVVWIAALSLTRVVMATFGASRQALKGDNQSHCLECQKQTLERCARLNTEAREFAYCRCTQCGARFRRPVEGKWETIPSETGVKERL